jgi:SAM-dependent methyltransferase
MHTITNCPICDHTSFKPFLKVKDYTVSQDYFTIVSCNNCGFHFTNPIPLEAEIGKYYKSESYISHSSTSKGFINKVYQAVRKYTLKKKVQLISRLSKGENVLDIGAGTGHFLNACKGAGFQVMGLEPDVDARSFAKNNFNVDLFPNDSLDTLEDESLNIVTMWHVLEHVYHLDNTLEKIHSILEKDGKLIIAVPNRTSYDANYYKEYWAAFDVPIHLYHFSPEDMNRISAKHHFEIDEILPMKFDSFYVSMLSEKYKKGNMMNAFWIGLKSNFKAKGNKYSSQVYILSKK